MEQLSYTPELLPHDSDRIVPHYEGTARLAAIRKHVEALPEPATDSISAETARQLRGLRDGLRDGLRGGAGL